MPLPPFLISAALFICRYALTEGDGVISAVRLVDLIYVPIEGLAPGIFPAVQSFVCVIVKSLPGHTEEHTMQLKMINTTGEWSDLCEVLKLAFTGSIPDAPGGATINLQLNIGVKNFGTCYVCLFVDGEEIARTPITLLRNKGETHG